MTIDNPWRDSIMQPSFNTIMKPHQRKDAIEISELNLHRELCDKFIMQVYSNTIEIPE